MTDELARKERLLSKGHLGLVAYAAELEDRIAELEKEIARLEWDVHQWRYQYHKATSPIPMA